MCTSNPTIVTKIEREEPSYCTPISFEDVHHPLIVELQQHYAQFKTKFRNTTIAKFFKAVSNLAINLTDIEDCHKRDNIFPLR